MSNNGNKEADAVMEMLFGDLSKQEFLEMLVAAGHGDPAFDDDPTLDEFIAMQRAGMFEVDDTADATASGESVTIGFFAKFTEALPARLDAVVSMVHGPTKGVLVNYST